MNDPFESLPQFPDESRETLPPPRRDWGLLLWPVLALATAFGLLLVLGRMWPIPLFVVLYGPTVAAMFGLFLLVIVAVLLYAGHRSGQR
jgi:hypothetical protein